MTEVYLHAQQSRKLLMMPEQDVVVSREGLQFPVAFLDADKCSVDGLNGYGQNLLKKCGANFAINHSEQDANAIITRDDEIRLCVPDPHPLVDR